MHPMLYPYSRISEADQVKGKGLEMQVDHDVLARLSQEHQLPIFDEVMSDVGKSAYKGHHLNHELGSFISKVKAGGIAAGSIIVVYSLDRLSRLQLGFAKQIYLDLTNNGCHIFSILDNHLYKAHNVADEIVSSIVFERAHGESATKSARTKGNALELIKDHREQKPGSRDEEGNARAIQSVGSLPWWVDTTSGYIKLHEDVAAVMREIIQKAIIGWGNNRIADWLASEVSVPLTGGRTWNYANISRLHTRKTLYGHYTLTLGGVEYELKDYIPPVIDEATYWQFVESKKSRTHSRTKNPNRSFMTGIGKFKCRHCGGSISGSMRVGKLRFLCITGNKEKHRCAGVNVTADHIEQAVLDSMNFLTMVPEDTSTSIADGLKIALNEVETKLNQVTKDYAANPISALAGVMATLEAEVKEKRKAYEEALQAPSRQVYMTEIPTDTDERRALVRRSIESIQIFKHKKSHHVVSIYYHRYGQPEHIYIHRGKVVKAGSFYRNLNQEEILKDRDAFALFVADGRLDEWLSLPEELDWYVDLEE